MLAHNKLKLLANSMLVVAGLLSINQFGGGWAFPRFVYWAVAVLLVVVALFFRAMAGMMHEEYEIALERKKPLNGPLETGF